MFKVLVVDDDNLSRKGFISIMPWEEFGLSVVGEAENGEKALEFLEKNPVDLLITDIEMPFMSGIELMRAVKRKYKSIMVVVLTMHQDFSFVQEALRLGAIDYIVKVQLEREQLKKVLERITDRMKEAKPGNSIIGADRILCFAPVGKTQPNYDEANFLSGCKIIYKNRKGMVICKYEGEGPSPAVPLKRMLKSRDTWLLTFEDDEKLKFEYIVEFIEAFNEKILFYYYKAENPHIVIGKEDRARLTDTAAESENEYAIFDNFEWIFDDRAYSETLDYVKKRYIDKDILIKAFAKCVDEHKKLKIIDKAEFDIANDICCFEIFEKYLSRYRSLLKGKILLKNSSNQIIKCIYKALRIMQENIESALPAEEIAKKVNMSRSYFNNSFKSIVGVSYHDKLVEIRLGKAAEYLENTDYSIKEIALMVGYKDD